MTIPKSADRLSDRRMAIQLYIVHYNAQIHNKRLGTSLLNATC